MPWYDFDDDYYNIKKHVEICVIIKMIKITVMIDELIIDHLWKTVLCGG